MTSELEIVSPPYHHRSDTIPLLHTRAHASALIPVPTAHLDRSDPDKPQEWSHLKVWETGVWSVCLQDLDVSAVVALAAATALMEEWAVRSDGFTAQEAVCS